MSYSWAPDKFGGKWTPLVTWVGVQALFLAFIGIDSKCVTLCVPSPRAQQSSFHPQIPTSLILLCFLMILDVETQVWRGRLLTHFGIPFADFREMTQNTHVTNRWVFFSNHFATMFVYQKNTRTSKIMQFGVVGDLLWTFGCLK